MATTAFGIKQASTGEGTSPLALRKCIQARWANTGIVTGLEVTGRSDLKYNVAAGVAVVSRSSTDGYSEAYWEGGTTDAVSAGDPSNPRIDLVWIKANDLEQGDDDNRVKVGVTQGTPAPSPTVPAAPAGCTPLMSVVMQAGATTTANAQKNAERSYAIPYGASLGMLGEYWDKRDWTTGAVSTTDYYEMAMSVTVPTDRLVRMTIDVNYSNTDYTTTDDPSEESYIFQIDGEDVPHTGFRFASTGSAWETHSGQCVAELSAGTHQIRLRRRHSFGPPAHYHYAGEDGDPWWIGRRAIVWDMGPAA